MSIIISKQGHNAQKLEKSDFEKEDYLLDNKKLKLYASKY